MKKWLVGLLACICVFAGAFGLASCDLPFLGGGTHECGEWVSNGNGTHSRTCEEDPTHNSTQHCRGGEYSCTEKPVCEVCNTPYGEPMGHSFTDDSEWVTNEDGLLVQQCARENCGEVDSASAHTPGLEFGEIGTSGSYLVKDYIGEAEEVVIPYKYNGCEVKAIGANAFKDCSITEIEIPITVEEIGDNAFYDCNGLTELELPLAIRTIGEWAFAGCSNLSKIHFPNSCVIDESAFSYCYALERVEVWAIIDWINMYFEDAWANPLCNGGTLYLEEEPVEYVTIPDKINHIGKYAFYRYSGLQGITLSKNVTTIEEGAFDGCENLQSVIIPNDSTLTRIDQYAFFGCHSLLTVNMPDGLSYIDEDTFNSCTSLEEIVIPDSVTFIGDRAFYECTNLSSVDFGDGLTYIGVNAFFDCDSLDELNLNDGLETIGDASFANCDSLEEVTIPASVTSMAWYTFANCDALTSVTFEVGSPLTSIGTATFQNCKNLTKVTLPVGLTEIANETFKECKALTEIVIPDSVTSIGDNAFYNCIVLTEIDISENVNSIGKYAFEGCQALTQITIPDSVTSIGDYAFADCKNLTSVTFGVNSELTTIGAWAFSNCEQLTEIVIPVGVESVGRYAFSDCYKLLISCKAESKPTGWDENWKTFYSNSEYVCPTIWSCNSTAKADDGYTYTQIDGTRYALKNNEATLVLQLNDVTTKTIPEKVTYKGYTYKVTAISRDAFANRTALTKVVIPDSVTSIGYGAFEGCTSLEEMTLPFIGKTKTGTEDTNFGYIFGSSGYYDANENVPESLKKVIITSATAIDDYAFYRCSSITGLVLPNTLKTIGTSAFAYCSSLTKVIIPYSVTTIGHGAFGSCPKLTLYMRIDRRPSGWDPDFYDWQRTEDIWGYTGD